jgi:nitrite reductase (NADH) large subunit
MSEATRAWRCTVCGYVHQGAAPPEACPACGAPAELFAPIVEAPAAGQSPTARQWRCLVCGYLHTGAEPPAACPACGAGADCFTAVAAATTPVAAPASRLDAVVIGAGIAGLSAVEALRSTAPDARITLISQEPELPYFRLNLTRFLAGEIGEDSLPIHDRAWYERNNVRLLLDCKVAAVRPAEQVVELSGGQRLPYDKLLLTTGAAPALPPLPGVNLPGVTALRTVADAHRILAACSGGAPCVCIGGGLLGLETAGALAQRGVDVTLLEGCDWLLPRQLNARAGELLGDYVCTQRIKLHTATRIAEIIGKDRLQGVRLGDGTLLPAGLVVIAIGVRPTCDLARAAGLELNRGVVVNDQLETSHAGIFAAGDVAEHRGVLYGIWGPAQYQGTIAGRNMGGATLAFAGVPLSNTLKVLGRELFSIGRVGSDDDAITLEDEADGRYCCLVFREGRLVGAILLGDRRLGPALQIAIESARDFTALLSARPTAASVMQALAEQAATGR